MICAGVPGGGKDACQVQGHDKNNYKWIFRICYKHTRDFFIITVKIVWNIIGQITS